MSNASTAYGGSCSESACPVGVVDKVFDDFDVQAAQFTGHDREYFQISAGAFRGRFLSVRLNEGVSLTLEAANQALEQRVGCPRDVVAFRTVFADRWEYEAFDRSLDRDRILVTKPGQKVNLQSPAGDCILALCIDRHVLESALPHCRLPRELDPQSGDIEIIDAPSIAEHFRSCSARVLNDDRCARDREHRNNLARLLVSSIVAQIALHQSEDRSRRDGSQSMSYQACWQAKRILLDYEMAELDYGHLRGSLGLSERSIQLAFARHAGMSPSSFHRAIRLTRVRRALLSRRARTDTIGNIAAEHGFWSWSRFTQLYKSQFGELPSETRSRCGSSLP